MRARRLVIRWCGFRRLDESIITSRRIGGCQRGKVVMRVPVRSLALALVTGALMFPGNLSAQSAPRTITTQDLAQTKNGGNDWITHGGALNNERYSTLNQINTSNRKSTRLIQ